MFDTIKKLIQILKEEDIDEIEIKRFFTTIRVSRSKGKVSAESSEIHVEAPRDASRSNSYESDEGEELKESSIIVSIEREDEGISDSSADNIVTIRSPMVGTFYRARSPESEPFVYEGKEVKVGEVLCIIEAMKLMNEIESEIDGVVERILVQDAQPVEYGQPLFLIKSA